MARPPGDPYRPSELATVRLEAASKLEQGGIAGCVVAHAFVPRVKVPMKQDEAVRLHRARDLSDDDRNLHPFLSRFRGDRSHNVAGPQLAEHPQTVGPIDRDHRNPGTNSRATQLRRSPHPAPGRLVAP